jgi:hypothetical protein
MSITDTLNSARFAYEDAKAKWDNGDHQQKSLVEDTWIVMRDLEKVFRNLPRAKEFLELVKIEEQYMTAFKARNAKILS